MELKYSLREGALIFEAYSFNNYKNNFVPARSNHLCNIKHIVSLGVFTNHSLACLRPQLKKLQSQKP